MSHTVKLRPDIKDARAIRSMSIELKQKGVDCELLTNAVPRMYYSNQHGACDFVLKLNGSRYDVGFVRRADGKGYELVFDPWGGDIARQIGNPSVQGANSTVAKMLQSYSKHAAINAATAKGYCVSGTTVDAKGNINLILNVP